MTPTTHLSVTLTLAQFWGGRITERRELLGFTQEGLASLAGVTQQTVSRIERGTNYPSDLLKVNLARCLGTKPGDLFVWPDMDVAA